MSRNATVEQPFADGDYTFRLGFKELILLQEARDCGPLELLGRLNAVQWRVEDIAETIRIGLIGGGVEPRKALKLVRDYVQDRPPMESLALAIIVLSHAVAGAPDEPLGESSTLSPKAPTTATASNSTISPTEKSDGASSTGSVPPWDSDQSKSTDGPGSSSGPPLPDGSAPIDLATVTN
jgi:tail tube GTA-gp10-like protein